MNYIEIINHFWQTQRTAVFTPNEAFLYLFLVQECNVRGWVNPFECSNGLICGSINMSEKTLIDVRNRLQQKGMISFESGQRKKKSPVYKILYCKKVSTNVSTSVSNSVGKNVSTTVNHILKLKETETKEIEIEKKAELNYPFSSSLFFEKWNLLASSPKWKVKATPSLQIALDGLKKFDEAFVIEMIDQAIVGEWSVFKGVELSDQYTKWQKQKGKPKKNAKESKARFRPPTLEEVKAYCLERKNKVDPEKFIDFYTSRGWKYNNTKISDWEACVRTWEKNNFDNGKSLMGNNPKLSEAYKTYQEQNQKKVSESHDKNDLLKVTPKEYKQMKDNGIEIKKDITPEELEEIRKKLKEL